MNRISFPFRSLLTPLMILYGCVSLAAQTNPHRVYTVGQLKDVKWKGELQARVLLDSLPGGAALYGMGPLSFLRGEIMLYASKTYVARVMADSAMQVKEETQADAPFFAYAIVPAWKSRALPDTVRNLQQLEAWLAT